MLEIPFTMSRSILPFLFLMTMMLCLEALCFLVFNENVVCLTFCYQFRFLIGWAMYVALLLIFSLHCSRT